MKILLGGVPFGCDNIGDEAILAAVVQMLREALPQAEITVATMDAETGRLLNVETVPPFGFAGCSCDGFAEVAARHDAYVWCGATGLSDYPDVALDLLEAAQDRGLPTFIWGVGMDDELNPVFFRAQGKRRLLLSAFGLVKWYEDKLRKRLSRRIQSILPKCRGIWLRDPESARILETFGYANAKVTADTAAFLPPPQEKSPQRKENAPAYTLGICISTQRQVTDLHGVETLISELRANGCRILGIPMNPRTDRELLRQMGVECISGTSPDAVMAAAASCDLVLSSRLHLLILAANVGTPGIGIARGSKLDNWLANFGAGTEGSVYECDWERVTKKALEMLPKKEAWQGTRDEAYSRLRKRFMNAKDEFIGQLRTL